MKNKANNKFLIGNDERIVDFIAYEIFKGLVTYKPAIFNDYKLRTYLDSFENIPNIKKFINSDKFLHKPFMPPYSKLQF